MILKTFILTTFIVIALKLLEYFAFMFSDHNLSRKGWNDSNGLSILYSIVKIAYIIVWSLFIIHEFLDWYYLKFDLL